MFKNWLNKQKGQNFKRRCCFLAAGIILMAFSISFLVMIDFGTDPIAAFAMGLSKHLGISFGTCLLLFNAIWFVVVILSAPEQIGLGTLANMVALGYIVDFFSWIWSMVLPDPSLFSFGLRIAILIPSILVFVVAASLYMTCDMGMSPDDAVVFICADQWLSHTKVGLTAVRMTWDAAYTVLAFLLGGTAGVVTVLIMFTLGPTLSKIRPIVAKQIMKSPTSEHRTAISAK